MTNRLLVSVIDDDESVRESLPDLIRELGYDAAAFSSGEEFLASGYLQTTSCLVVDVMMPGMTGIDVHRELEQRGKAIPVVFITAHREEANHLLVERRGVAGCLLKPFSDTELQAALSAATQATP